MGFLQPLFLLLGVGVAVPLILHLFQRHQGPRVIFPAIRYLRRAEKENARRIKLRQLLLLLLRVAAVLLLALAAARPFSRTGGGQHEPAAVVLVLDNSMSTSVVDGDHHVLDELKARALESLHQAGPDDRFWLLRAATPGEPALLGDASATARRVRETSPTAAAADIASALEHARTLLATGAGGRAPEIELLSDLQRTDFPPATAPPPGAPPLVVWVPSGAPPPNRAVASVQVAGGLTPIAGERSTVAVTVAGSAATDSVSVRLSVDGRIAAAGRAPGAAAAVLPFPAHPAGLATGWVEIDADALRTDDRRYFATRVRPAPGVAVSGPQEFLDNALSVMADAGRVAPATPDRAAILIALAGEGLGLAAAGGTVVVLPPDSAEEVPATNRRLTAANIPWQYEPAPARGEARFSLADTTDELAGTLRATRLHQVYHLQPQQGAADDTALLRLQDGAVWAVRGDRPGGRYILLASPLDSSGSTLPTSAAMMPLLDRILGAWAGAEPEQLVMTAGEETELPPEARAVQRPDGKRDAAPGDGRFRFGPETGLYRVLGAGDSLITAFAVNPPERESLLSRLDARDLRRALTGWNLTVADRPSTWGRAIYRRRLGHELWRPVLLILLLILVVEAWAAATGRTRRDADGPVGSDPRPRAGRRTTGPGTPQPHGKGPSAAVLAPTPTREG